VLVNLLLLLTMYATLHVAQIKAVFHPNIMLGKHIFLR